MILKQGTTIWSLMFWEYEKPMGMKDKKEFEAWKLLFQREQKGKSPEELSYAPNSLIRMAPYIPQSAPDNPDLEYAGTEILHSFWVDNDSARWIAEVASQFSGYAIHSGMGSLDLDSVGLLKTAFQQPGSDAVFESDAPLPQVLDLGKEDVMIETRAWLKAYSKDQGIGIAFLPGDDFIWNVAMIRGIGKFLIRHFDNRTTLTHAAIYTPLNAPSSPDDESRLIPLTNQILAMMVCGISRCIWDIRKATDWQKTNLKYYLNIPEILSREGKVLQDQDPIRGSGLFEELSDRIGKDLES